MADTTYALQQVVAGENGSADKVAAQMDRPVAAKTGSSSDNKSAQFVGFTPQVVTAVTLYQTGDDGSEESITPWGEYDEVTGSTYPADIFIDYMKVAHEGLKVEEFPEAAEIPATRGGGRGSAKPTAEPEEEETVAPTSRPEETQAPAEQPTGEATPQPEATPQQPGGSEPTAEPSNGGNIGGGEGGGEGGGHQTEGPGAGGGGGPGGGPGGNDGGGQPPGGQGGQGQGGGAQQQARPQGNVG